MVENLLSGLRHGVAPFSSAMLVPAPWALAVCFKILHFDPQFEKNTLLKEKQPRLI
jgi:hypothetical protein